MLVILYKVSIFTNIFKSIYYHEKNIQHLVNSRPSCRMYRK